MEMERQQNPNTISSLVRLDWDYLKSFCSGWQKAVMVFIGLSLCAGLISICVGFCSPCSPAYALIYSFLTFVTCKFGEGVKNNFSSFSLLRHRRCRNLLLRCTPRGLTFRPRPSRNLWAKYWIGLLFLFDRYDPPLPGLHLEYHCNLPGIARKPRWRWRNAYPRVGSSLSTAMGKDGGLKGAKSSTLGLIDCSFVNK